jgi:hypothetical protein
MKSAVVVLACLASALGAPEADPQVFLNAGPAAFPFAASPFRTAFADPTFNPAFNTLNPAFNTFNPAFAAPFPAQIAPAVIPAPAVFRTAPVLVAAPAARLFTPHDCVTQGGCAARAILESQGRLVRREAEAEAEPQHLINPYAYTGYNNLYANYHNAHYNPYTYNAFPQGYNNFYGGAYPYLAQPAPFAYAQPAPFAYAQPAPFAIEAAPLALEAAPLAIEAPLLKTLPIAAPAHIVLEAAPQPIFHSAPIVHHAAPIVHHAAPAFRALRPVPVVEKRAKVVTYTHLGAHPVNPLTVIEEETRHAGVVLA